jgi:hypothetical protein
LARTAQREITNEILQFGFTAPQQSAGVHDQGQFVPQLWRSFWLLNESKQRWGNQ